MRQIFMRARWVDNRALIALSLALLSMLPYLHGVNAAFIELDDPEYVIRNINVLNGLTWQGTGWAMTTFELGHWHPLIWLSHMAAVALFGVDPRGHHLLNILLHGLNSAILFVALARLTGSPWPSAFVAAIFGIHPLHVESVAWVAGRTDVLAGFFFMLVLLAYEWYARLGTSVRLLTVTLLLALGLMAKPMLVTVPFVLLLLDVWPLGRTSWVPPAGGGKWVAVPWGRLFLEKAPLFALSLAGSLLAVVAKREALADLESIPPGMRMANAVVSYAVYLGKTVWPSRLAILYPYPPHGHSFLKVLGLLLLLAALSWAILSRFRRAPFLGVGWLWYLGMLMPVIGIVQAGEQARADRYMYLPLVGVIVAVAWGASRIVPDGWNRAALLGSGACLAVVALTTASWVQVGYWKDSETLFRHTLSVTSGNWLIENNLGLALATRGMNDEAEVHFREALRLWPDYPEAHNNLGSALARQGRGDEAEAHLREALRLRPDYPGAHNNLGNALARQGRADEAIVHFREALRLRPDYPGAHYNLGNALRGEGRVAEAMVEYREALRLTPDFPDAHNNLGTLLRSQGKPEEAIGHFREALRLKPDLAAACNNLGNALSGEGRIDEAIVYYREAIRRKPDFPGAHYNLGNALRSKGRGAEATVEYREALRLRPDSVEAHENLAGVLAELGRHQEAQRHIEEARKLQQPPSPHQ